MHHYYDFFQNQNFLKKSNKQAEIIGLFIICFHDKQVLIFELI